MRSVHLYVLVATFLAMCTPAPADAASLRLGGRDGARNAAVYEAAPGEVNFLQIQEDLLFFEEAVDLELESPEVDITAERPCFHPKIFDDLVGDEPDPYAEPYAAQCPRDGVTSIDISLNDKDDFLDARPAELPVTADGASGDDWLLGSPHDDGLRGGPGDDTLIGGGGPDVLDGGHGSDTLWGFTKDMPLGRRVDAEDDTATYAGRSEPVTVTLNDQADDGAEGEGDNVTSAIENVVGGDGGDVISGSEQANRLSGGPGDDTLNAYAGGTDTLECGPGTDSVVVDETDMVATDCEQVDRRPAPPDTKPPLMGFSIRSDRIATLMKRGARVTIFTTEPVTASLEIRWGGRTVGHATVGVARVASVAVHIDAHRGELAGSRSLRLVAALHAEDAAGNARDLRSAVRLHR